jgi:hypothetical protein
MSVEAPPRFLNTESSEEQGPKKEQNHGLGH